MSGLDCHLPCCRTHVAGQWEKEDKATKQLARDMAAMAANINSEQLKKIKNLKGPDPVINCTTCHRPNQTSAQSTELARPGK
jgi:hypothetical protein